MLDGPTAVTSPPATGVGTSDRVDRVGAVGVARLAEADLVPDRAGPRPAIGWPPLVMTVVRGDGDRAAPAVFGGERELRTADRPDRDRSARRAVAFEARAVAVAVAVEPALPLPRPLLNLRALSFFGPLSWSSEAPADAEAPAASVGACPLGAAVIAMTGMARARPAARTRPIWSPHVDAAAATADARWTVDDRLDGFLDHDRAPGSGAIRRWLRSRWLNRSASTPPCT